jgi:enamine deaminase RidA (YjgF/YER057c/UK114 family)
VLGCSRWCPSYSQAGRHPPQPPKRRAINLPGQPVQAPFRDGIVVGDTLYLAGRIGIDPKTGKPLEEIEKEIHLVA